MYEKALKLIDKVIDVLMSEISSVEEEVSASGEAVGADELTNSLENKLCFYLTKRDAANIEALQRLEGKFVDADKMMGFLKISCSEYLSLKDLLANKEIQNIYYDTRIACLLDLQASYRIATCLTLLTLATRTLDTTEIKVQIAEEKALNILGSIPQCFTDLHAMISARVKDGIVSDSALPIVRILPLLEALSNIPDILISGFEARQAFIKDLCEIIAAADAGLKEEEPMNSEQSGFRRGIYLRVRNEAQEILDAIRIAYPNDATLSPVAAEKEPEFTPDGKGLLVIEAKQPEEYLISRKDKENKQEIDCFINGVKLQPMRPFMPGYSACLKKLIEKHKEFVAQYDAVEGEDKAKLIGQFKTDVLKIIETKMNERSAVIGKSREELSALRSYFLKTTEMIHYVSASASSSSDSPPQSLFFRKLSRSTLAEDQRPLGMSQSADGENDTLNYT